MSSVPTSSTASQLLGLSSDRLAGDLVLSKQRLLAVQCPAITVE